MPTVATTADIEALEAQAQRLMATFTRAGYERIEPAVIQPADLFLDVVGESLRARTYVFTDPDGAELCLRPDLTVPTCRLHLDRHPAATSPARYCYSGPAFRYQPAGADRAHPREFRQAGIESFAAADREARRRRPCSPSPSRRCATPASAASRSGSATSACSPRSSRRSPCPSAGARGSSTSSGARKHSAPSCSA